jgi:uncharacterized OsmC-like protein
MSQAEELKAIYERKVRAIRVRPSAARMSSEAKAHVLPSLSCEVQFECGGSVKVGASTAEGGAGDAPTPGQLMRASVSACLAIGYKAWSARLAIPIDDVFVDMHFETDLRGQLGIEPDILPGWNKIVYTVRITTSAPEEDVQRLVQIADRTSAMMGSLRSEIERVRTVEIIRPPQNA